MVKTEFEAFARFENGAPLKKFTYEPRPLGFTDVEIDIICCGICGSDLHTLDSEWGPTNYPVVVGHEIVGTVKAKGDGVTRFNIGDMVGVGAQVHGCLKPDCSACSRDFDSHCPSKVFTYNDKYSDGGVAYGGYAKNVRVDSNYAFAVPSMITPAEAAPLMCAGATVFSPMLHNKFKAGDRVGVVGIGGLGHLALQFANALGCVVTAFSSNATKKDECLKLGASNFVDISNKEQVQAAAQSLDFLLITSSSDDNDYNMFASWVDLDGQIILLALPAKPLVLHPFLFVGGKVSIAGSLIGGVKHIQETLDFSAKHNIRPMIQKMPMEECNAGVDIVREGKARYRVVLEN